MCYTFLILNVRFNIEFTTLSQTYSDLRSADNKNDFRPYVSFTGFAFYIAVRCGFDKHLYLISCLTAHNHNTCIRLPQIVYTARKWHSSLVVKIAKHNTLAANGIMPWQLP